MDTKVTKYNNLDQDQIDLIKRTIAKNATNDELNLFLYYCNKTGLDPLAHQIWFIKMNGQLNIQVSIDGLRLVAERSGLYAGQDGAVFTIEEINDKEDLRCDVTVYKFSLSGVRYPVATGTAYLSEYSSNNPLWKTKPRVMLSKVAESLALRKGFPLELSGIYTPEEFSNVSPTITPATTPMEKPKVEDIDYDDNQDYEEELEIPIDDIPLEDEYNEEELLQKVDTLKKITHKKDKEEDDVHDGDKCPECVKNGRDGIMVTRHGNYGEFLGCNKYPSCDFTYTFKKKR